MEFVDIHCHILAAVDDGAATESDMFSMLDLAYEDGVRKICMTPHYDVDLFGYNSESAAVSFAAAQNYVAQNLPGLKLFLGNELSYRISNLEDLQAGRCRTLAGGRYVLVDFLDQPNAAAILRALDRFCCAGYIPVVAHVERYPCLAGKFREIEYLSGDGVLFQVNATSLSKSWINAERRAAERLLARGLVDVIASDAHDTNKRAPILSASYHAVAARYGEEYAELLFRINPEKILENKAIRA